MRIPLFPLNTVLFPGSEVRVHVFEERYRTMLARLLDDEPAEAAFGVVNIREGFEVGVRAEVVAVGTLAVIGRAVQHPDGTSDLIATGTRRFQVVERLEDDPYPQAEVEFLVELAGPRADEALRLATEAIERCNAVISGQVGEIPPPLELPEDPIEASYAAIEHLKEVELPVLQRLLEATTASERLALVATHARREASLIESVGWPLRRMRIDASMLN